MAQKTGKVIVPTEPASRAMTITGFTFKSYDKKAGVLQFEIKNQDGSPTDLIDATVRLFMYIYQGEEKKEFPIFDNQIITESYMQGVVKYPIPDMLLSYEGKVDVNVYIDFPDGSHTDNLAFTFNIEKSVIDDNVQLNGEYYFKDFQQLLDGVKQEATDAVNETLAKVEASSTKMQELERRIDEQTEIFNNADVYNKAEIEDKLEPFALRTDIDSLSIEKADKTFVDAQLAKKATKGEIGLSDLDKNKTQLDETWIADSLKQQIVGNAPIHSEPLNDSVINAHLADKSVYMNTLSLPDATYLPNTLTFESGTPTSTGITNSTTRGVSTVHTFKKGDTVKAVTSDVEFSVYKRNGTGGFTPVSGGWFTNQTIQEDIEGVIYSRFKDDRNLSDLTQQRLMGNSIIIDNDDVAARKRELKDITQRFFTDFEMGFFGPSGTFTSDDNRVRTPDYITIKADTTIKLADPDNTDYAVLIEGSGHYISGGWSKEPIYFSEETRILVGQRYSDNRVISISDFPFFSNNFIRLSDDSLLRLRDLKDVLHVPSNTQTTVFVTLNGDDNNHGMSSTSPLATLQKALDTRASVIYVERGVYYNQSIDADVDKVKILPLDNDSWDSNERSPVQKIEFRGSDKLDNSLWETYNSIHRQPYDGNGYFRNVFIDKTSPPETASSRPSYNAVIWEKTNELENDYKMKPVLTLGECENEQGTFYYDGSYVYVNPIDINNDFHSITLNRGLSIKGNSVELHDVVFNYYMSEPMNLDNIKHLRAQNCEANYSGQGDGFSLDYTNGELANCLAAKNRNDGFNLHFYGDTVLTNCSGLYNYDDGISHHEGCTGVINGGKWIGNGKGGVAPAYGCKVNWNNCLLKGNGYGAYHQHRENDVNIHNVSSGNLYVDNGVAILNHYAELTSFNDTFINNQTEVAGNGVTNVY